MTDFFSTDIICHICDKYKVCPKFYDTNSCETHSGAVDSFTFNFDETVKKRLGLCSRSRTSLSLPLSHGAQLPNAWFQLSTKFGRCNSSQLFAANNTGQSGITIAELFLLEWAENSEKSCATNPLIIVRIVNASQFTTSMTLMRERKKLDCQMICFYRKEFFAT